MARPVSKYFTPVIRKIIEARKREEIIIDERFKAALRAEVMARAAGLAGSLRGEGEGLYDRALDFLNKWKYQLALAPVALVMVMVAAQSFKMPVQVRTETVVPAESAASEGTAVQSATGGYAGRKETEAPEIKAISRSELSVPAKTVPEGQVSADAERAENASRAVPVTRSFEDTALPAPAAAKPSELQGTGIRAGYAEEQDPAGQTEEAQDQTGTTREEEVVLSSDLPAEKRPGTVAGDLPTDLPEQEQSGAEDSGVAESADDAGQLPEEEVRQGDEGVADAVPVSTTGTDASADTEMIRQTRTVNGVKVVEVVPAVSEVVLPVSYDVSFDADLKEDFEENVLVNLVAGQDVAMVSVRKKTDGVVSVEVGLKDGTIRQTYYLKNAATGVWNEVKYVQRYYYDDSLQYVRSYDFRPAAVYPYYYPYLNRQEY